MPPSPDTLQVLFVLQDDSLVLDWAGPAEALRLASLEIRALKLQAAPFALRFAAARAEATGSVGLQLQALEPLPEQLPPGSWVVLVGRTSAAEQRARATPPAAERALAAWLARLAPGAGCAWSRSAPGPCWRPGPACSMAAASPPITSIWAIWPGSRPAPPCCRTGSSCRTARSSPAPASRPASTWRCT